MFLSEKGWASRALTTFRKAFQRLRNWSVSSFEMDRPDEFAIVYRKFATRD